MGIFKDSGSLSGIETQINRFISPEYVNRHAFPAALTGIFAGLGTYMLIKNMNVTDAKDFVDDVATIAVYDNIKDVISGVSKGAPDMVAPAIAMSIPVFTKMGNYVADYVVAADPVDPNKVDITKYSTIALAVGLLTAFAVFITDKN